MNRPPLDHQPIQTGDAAEASAADRPREETRPAARTSGRPNGGVFSWYPYVQDFSGDFAIEWLSELSKPGELVWDPFLGSGTTTLAAMLLGRRAAGYDMNPLMVDVARAKTDWSIPLEHLRQEADSALVRYAEACVDLPPEPPAPVRGKWSDYPDVLNSHSEWGGLQDPKLRKWISPLVLARVDRLIKSIAPCRSEAIRRLLRIAVASQLVALSNMTLRPNIGYASKPTVDAPLMTMFSQHIAEMIDDYGAIRTEQAVQPLISIGDARCAGPDRPNVVFTSPPYPNDMEYIHQTRLELLLPRVCR